MDFDLETFYRERDEIMNQPDEDLDDYWGSKPTGIKSHFTQETSASNLAPFPFLEDSNESAAPDDLDRLRTDGPSGSRPGLQRVSSTARPSIGHKERKTSLRYFPFESCESVIYEYTQSSWNADILRKPNI